MAGKATEFVGSRDEWLAYMKRENLRPANLYEIDRKKIVWLVLPNGQKRPFTKK